MLKISEHLLICVSESSIQRMNLSLNTLQRDIEKCINFYEICHILLFKHLSEAG